jgi:excinuclease ABC subunit A
VTEIYDYLRLLFARAGTPYSPATGLPIEAQQVQDMVDRVMAMEEGTRAYLLAPIVRDRKGEYRKEFLELRKQGFQRVKVDGEFHELDTRPRSTRSSATTSTWWSTGSWCARGWRPGWPTVSAPRSTSPTASRSSKPRRRPGRGRARAHHLLRELRLPGLGLHHPRDRAAPVLLQRALRRLPGVRRAGVELFFDERLVVPDARCRSPDGALAPWRKGKSPYFLQTIEAIAKHYGSTKAKWKDLPEDVQQVFLRGSGEEEIQFRYDEGGRVYQVKRTFEGVIPNMERRYRETDAPGSARSSSATRTTAPAAPAAATGCGPRRWR